jgi:hypothetical protein
MSSDTTLLTRPRLARSRPQPNRSKQRRHASNKQAPAKVLDAPLLIERREARRMLGGISGTTIWRLEQTGKLTPVKLDDSPNAKVFYRYDEIVALAAGGDDA